MKKYAKNTHLNKSNIHKQSSYTGVSSKKELFKKIFNYTVYLIAFMLLMFMVAATRNALVGSSENSLMVIKNVEVKNQLKRVRKKDILKTLKISPNTKITSYNLPDALDRILKLPWVKDAVISKNYPDTISVYIEEENMIAVWDSGHNYYPVTEEGNIIDYPVPYTMIFLNLAGSNAYKKAKQAIEIVDMHPEVKKRILYAELINNRRWNLVLDDEENSLKILLPSENPEEAMKRLIERDKKTMILRRMIKEIDMRYKNDILIKIDR